MTRRKPRTTRPAGARGSSPTSPTPRCWFSTSRCCRSSSPRGGLGWLLVLAWSHAVLSLAYLLVLVTGLHSARRLLMRRKVRRTLDATTGAVLLGFGAKLATEHV